MAKVTIYPHVDAMVAHLPGVVGEVRDLGDDVAAKARANLGAHRDTGAAKIEVDYGVTDVTVSLVDKAAMSIEYGHDKKDGTHVPGLYIITKAAGFA